MYDAIGMELTADAQGAMRHWLAHRPREPQRPSYALEDYGLTDSQVDERFTAYRTRLRPGPQHEGAVSD